MARFAVATPFFALGTFFVVRCGEPGVSFASAADAHPRGFYLTVVAIGLSLAALSFAIGTAVMSARFRRYGGLMGVSMLAVVAGALPYLVFKWSAAPEILPWAHFAQDGIVFLGFGQRTLAEGILIQQILAITAIAAAGAQVMVWRNGGRFRRELRAILRRRS